MGYAVYGDQGARDKGVERWAGYGVPAICDWPDCTEEIDRGLGYKCETRYVFDSDDEELEVECCGLYFCSEHEGKDYENHDSIQPKPDTPSWVYWMVYEESWQKWREENPEKAQVLYDRISTMTTEELTKAEADYAREHDDG